ncbi:MAG TPA: fatty acid desaturase [Nannocystis sp.]|jgi:fatty acid desaturase
MHDSAAPSEPAPSPPPRAPGPLDHVDFAAFLADIQALRRELDDSLEEADFKHLQKMERWGRAATAVGLLTCWIGPNPLSAAALGLGRSTRWLLMHHVGHRGYDKVPGVPPRYTSKVFARGARRWLDWLDWIVPEAWIYEHNVLHHSHTGEERDPDLVERNTEALRAKNLPKLARYGIVAGLAATWRATYYAPETMRQWLTRRDGADGSTATTTEATIRRRLLTDSYLPYALANFVLLPAAFLPLGPWAATSALINSVFADVLTNLHTFLVVGPNHTGDDLYRFASKPGSRGEHFARQVIGSTNYACGTNLVDFAHLWLNYQIEHHLFPDMPMLKYQQMQPRVKALCDKHGITYTQEGVFRRFRKLVDVIVGDAQMGRA